MISVIRQAFHRTRMVPPVGNREQRVALFALLLMASAAVFIWPDIVGNRTAPEPARPEQTAPPRIPEAGAGHSDHEAPRPPISVDPTCRNGCLVRVPADVRAPILWRRGAVAYAGVDRATLSELRASGREPLIVGQADRTVGLYVLWRVGPEDEALVNSLGTVLDRFEDIRLLEANAIPLHVEALYAAGIWVEKLPPPVFRNPEETPTFLLHQTISEIVAIGASANSQLGDRQYDAPGTIEAAEYLFRRFAELGYEVRYEDFIDGQGHDQLNVVAIPPGRQIDSEMILVTAHYDSISPAAQPAPGADDNASGVAAMLAIAGRAARAGFPYPLGFVAFGAEEPGLLGSSAFVDRLAQEGTELGAVINLDAIGIPHDGEILVNGDQDSHWIYEELAALVPAGYRLEWSADPNFLSDDEHFRRQGYAAVMLTTHPWGTEPVHHTADDRLERLDLDQITDIIDLVWRWVSRASSD